MIAFTDVRVRYPRQARDALRDVSLTAPRGKITAVVGPNGSGKSTLVRALLGRVPLAGGAIALDGADVGAQARDAIARRVAVVTSARRRRSDRVREYVPRPAAAQRGLGARCGRRSPGIDARCKGGSEALAERTVHELSGASGQRVRFARALRKAETRSWPTSRRRWDIAHEDVCSRLLGVSRATVAPCCS